MSSVRPTINLLPPAWRRVRDLDRRAGLVWGWLIIGLIGIVAIWYAARAGRSDVADQVSRLQQQTAETTSATEYDTLSTQLQSLSTLAQGYQTTVTKDRAWDEVFAYLETTIPAEVTIQAVSVSENKNLYDAVISGIATNRTAIGTFRENLLSYRSTPASPARVSQAVIDSISSQPTSGQQKFSIRATFDLGVTTKKP